MWLIILNWWLFLELPDLLCLRQLMWNQLVQTHLIQLQARRLFWSLHSSRFGGNAKVVHFLGSLKPWNYSYDAETKSIRGHPQEPCTLHPDFLLRWWDVFCTSVTPMLKEQHRAESFLSVSSHDIVSRPIPSNLGLSPHIKPNLRRCFDTYDESCMSSINIHVFKIQSSGANPNPSLISWFLVTGRLFEWSRVNSHLGPNLSLSVLIIWNQKAACSYSSHVYLNMWMLCLCTWVCIHL